MFGKWMTLASAALLLAAAPASDQQSSLEGSWDVTVSFAGGSASGVLKLSVEGGRIEGTSEPLDENQFFPLSVTGTSERGAAELEMRTDGELAGRLRLERQGQALQGSGTLYGVPVTLTGRREGLSVRAPVSHDHEPHSYQLQYSSRPAPTLRIAPGDRVRTTTLDNEGKDRLGHWRAMPGNTLTGPFYVEGAMPGDTLVVHLERVSLSRDTAKMYGGTLNQKAVGTHPQTATEGWGRTWLLDRRKGTARLKEPRGRLEKLELPLNPIVGSIGVAPPLNMALYAGDVWIHGGNLDYRRVTTGTTLHMPVYRAGAYLFLGDGHAAQGDGEISGQGLETSLDVQFRVELVKDSGLGQLWSEDADYVMVHGIDNTLDASLQMATSGMARWLKTHYALTDSEAATLLSGAIRYEIAAVVNTRPHVVALLAKSTLAMLGGPVNP